MKKRGTLFPVGAGRYVALPPGEPSDPGELYVAVFGPPPRLKTLAGHSVHMTRLKSARKHFGQDRVRAVGRTFYLRSDLERTLLG
jgi:hypothetical protein